jgi:hydrophobe/amphiphile efflux-3 (HAE3) family protein
MLKKLTYFSIDHPKLVIALTLLITAVFLLQFPKIHIDTDPENMLEAEQPDRVFYDQVKEEFGIRDMLVLGITDEAGIFRPETLGKIARITEGILQIEGVIVEDVISFTTTDNVTSDGGLLNIRRIMESVPQTPDEIDALRSQLYENPLFVEKLISADGNAVALYIPIERKDLSYRISKQIEAVAKAELGQGQRYYIAGLPVAEDTFGFEMFTQMAILAPLAGLVIFLLLYVLFRKVSLIISPMAVAMLSVIWGMGALIGTGFTVHIMSSMIPIFLMPIAVLDSVHILSEFYDRYPTLRDRKQTLLKVTDELFTPMLYTSVTSAVGFLSLTLAPIPPVQVFGGFVAFGIMAAWLLTVTLIPASIMLISEEKLLAQVDKRKSTVYVWERFLPKLGQFAFHRSKLVVAVSALLVVLGGWGISKIVVNDNPVKWFKPNHPIRQADRVMNQKFGGTYMAYLTVEGQQPEDMKRPEVVAYIDRLQEYLESQEQIGKTSSVVDIIKRVGGVLRGDGSVGFVPDNQEEIGQYLFLFLMSGDPNDLDNFVDNDYQKANIWVQLKQGENLVMENVVAELDQYTSANPPPEGIRIQWSGLTYINKVWQDLMVKGMRNALLGGALTVFVLMVILFRSVILALVSMMPLTFAIVLSYGLLGFIGKDYDMPVAVISSLALGLSIDFAIHFIQRFRRKFRELGDLEATNRYMFGEPGRAITRNALVIIIGFFPLVFATLTPYVTVGTFFVLLMTISALTTLVVMPALMRVMERRITRTMAAGKADGATA